MLEKLLALFGFKNNKNDSHFTTIAKTTSSMVHQIRASEAEIPQGKQIYSAHFRGYILSIDREFTGRYRISVFVGNHKVYGFSIIQKQITDEQFQEILNQVLSFLAEDPSHEKMPDSDLMESHFFGNP